MKQSNFDLIWKKVDTALGQVIIEKNVPYNAELSIKECGANISVKRIEELVRSGIYVLIKDDFKFAVRALNHLKKSLNKSKPSESNKPQKIYKKENEWKQNKSTLTARIIFSSKNWASILEVHQQINLKTLCEISMLAMESFSCLMPLKQILALNSSYQRYFKGIKLLGLDLHPFYGVYVPIRSEPVKLIDDYLRKIETRLNILEIGTGSGILSFIASRYGHQVMATDTNLLSILSAEKNAKQFDFSEDIKFSHHSFYQKGSFDLVICNPPWIPKRVENLLDQAIFYEDDFFDQLFLNLKSHLNDKGKLILIYSNFAALVGLQTKSFIEDKAKEYNLKVTVISQYHPTHKKIQHVSENHFRKEEIVSLYEIFLNN